MNEPVLNLPSCGSAFAGASARFAGGLGGF
jgi:hypothetical protein